MNLLERIRWIKSHMAQPKLLVNGDEFKKIANLVERDASVVGTHDRYIIAHPDGRAAFKESSAIYLQKIGNEYLTSKLMIYKEAGSAQKAIDKSCALKDCKVVPVTIRYEIK